ncbi:uncharacterized protein LOC144074291 isoform X2 [Stigmatopora argus]
MSNEDSERHCGHLEDAQTVMHKQDVQQLVKCEEEFPSQVQDHRLSHQIKNTEEDLEPSYVKEEGEELDIISAKSKDDKAPESEERNPHCPWKERRRRPPADKLVAPLSDCDDIEDTNNFDGEANGKPSEGSEKKAGFKCSICGKLFAQNGPMIRHLRTHTGEKPFTCSVCGKGFSNKSDMVRHMRTHTGEKPFNCSLCEKRFTQKESLVAHVRTHTGEKPFICSVCGKMFSQNSSMVAHMRIHTGEKPYSCSVCGKRFILKPNMVSHMRTHSGEKPYSCSVCKKTFSFKSCVVTHMRTHTGEKPFRCSLCGERYAQRANLSAHKRMHKTE